VAQDDDNDAVRVDDTVVDEWNMVRLCDSIGTKASILVIIDAAISSMSSVVTSFDI
jgi:hypothetical protein